MLIKTPICVVAIKLQFGNSELRIKIRNFAYGAEKLKKTTTIFLINPALFSEVFEN